MRINLLLLALLINLTLSAQKRFEEGQISKRTNKAVKKIEKVNELMSSAIGYSGTRPKQWDNFEELKRKASKEELKELTNHPNGVVRSYAFWALTYDKDVDLFEIVKNHLNDDEIIYTLFGCTGMQEKVGDFFIEMTAPEYGDLESMILNQHEIRELDSLLIYKPNNLSSRFGAINRAEPTKKLYPKIRELVLLEKNPEALVTLAKYQKKHDIELIKNFQNETEGNERGFYYTYSAVKQFPNAAFIPLLEKNLRKTLDNTGFSYEWRELYKAIASFKNEKSLELLRIPFTQVQHQNIKEYHIDFVFEAVLDFPDPIYDELLWEIWEEENRITINSCKYLLSLNASRGYELIKRELIENYIVQNSDFVPEMGKVEKTGNTKEFLLNVIRANDNALSYEIIAEHIENANVHDLALFTSKVDQQDFFIVPLFNRLEIASNPHIYLDIIETLIKFEDEHINQKIVEIRDRNKNLNEGWGGKALDKLLDENNIK